MQADGQGLVHAAAGHLKHLETPPNPSETAVRQALDLYRAAGCDRIVALGGGSPIDPVGGARRYAGLLRLGDGAGAPRP
ncbi:iron-containing alcohol dehydrogenase [Rhizobium sp. LCM 4573]|uniref:iron-containing alcohol dehydrogenase n=1 Tax=Rhizobium sp. LCM 4573 TaxID=1848291 RepID=UPI001FCDB9B0|nr:iron-containing alcohol dehydrogenase [Rhizobium sp. LCM 4573]